MNSLPASQYQTKDGRSNRKKRKHERKGSGDFVDIIIPGKVKKRKLKKKKAKRPEKEETVVKKSPSVEKLIKRVDKYSAIKDLFEQNCVGVLNAPNPVIKEADSP